MNTTTYGTDWNNIDMHSPYETSLNLIENLTFDTLLLEIGCNCVKIDGQTITAQFEEDLRSRIESAREIFQANLESIIRKAKLTRASN
jgi:phosphotransferase system IIA component